MYCTGSITGGYVTFIVNFRILLYDCAILLLIWYEHSRKKLRYLLDNKVDIKKSTVSVWLENVVIAPSTHPSLPHFTTSWDSGPSHNSAQRNWLTFAAMEFAVRTHEPIIRLELWENHHKNITVKSLEMTLTGHTWFCQFISASSILFPFRATCARELESVCVGCSK